MKKIIYFGALVLLAVLLAGLPACDSSSSGGGTTTGYSLADLAGVWEVRFGGGGDRSMIIDDQGRVRNYSRAACGYANAGWVFQVFSDGRVWAKGWYHCSLWPAGSSLYARWNGQFVSSTLIRGTVSTQLYIGGVLQATSKLDFSMRKQ